MGVLDLLLSGTIKQIEAMTKINHCTDDEGHFDLPCNNAVVSPLFGALRIAFPELDPISEPVPLLAGRFEVPELAT